MPAMQRNGDVSNRRSGAVWRRAATVFNVSGGGEMSEKDYIKEHLRLVTIEVEAKRERLEKFNKEEAK